MLDYRVLATKIHSVLQELKRAKHDARNAWIHPDHFNELRKHTMFDEVNSYTGQLYGTMINSSREIGQGQIRVEIRPGRYESYYLELQEILSQKTIFDHLIEDANARLFQC